MLLTVGSAFGIAAALERSGGAGVLASGLVQVAIPFGEVGVLVAIYALTALLAGAVSTKTSAAVMFPIAAHTAGELGISLLATCYVVMLAGSTAFSTPIGYPTNLMVLSGGGYKYRDFIKLGLPLQVLVGVSTIVIVWWRWLP